MCNQLEPVCLKIGTNLLRSEQKVFKLPSLDKYGCFLDDATEVELVLLGSANYSIESFYAPIRMGKFFGNRIFLNTIADQYNVNPKFIWDAKANVWVLYNAGCVCFAEQDIEYQTCHKLWGKDA